MKPFVPAFLFAALFSGAFHLEAAPADLDLSFAGSGMTRLGFGFGEDSGRAVAVQADGKLVVAGSSSLTASRDASFSLVRYGTNNLPDPSFGFRGMVMTPVSTAGLNFALASATAVKVQVDGKIVAAGYAYTRESHADFTLVRYHPDGSLDTTFGTNGTGIVYTDFGEGSLIRDMAIQADGRIVVAGHTSYPANAGEGAVALARYQTNGTLDVSFGSGGMQVTTGVTGYTGAHSLMIQPDGKIVAAGIGIGPGHHGVDFAVYRYTTNGIPDGEFGGGTGRVFTPIAANPGPGFHYFDSANAVALLPGNNTIQNPDKIIVAGSYHNSDLSGHSVIALARYRLDGVLDSTFGNGGIVTNAVGIANSDAQAIVLQGSGLLNRKILVAGRSGPFGGGRFLLVRYNLNGSFDATFNGTGHVITPIGSNDDEAQAMIFQMGKIVVAGSSRVNAGDTDFALARYNSDGSPDNSFDGDGALTTGIADRPSAAKAVAIQADGKTVLAGYADTGVNEVFALARFNRDGSPDFSFGVHGKVVTSIGTGSARANAAVIQPDGKIIAAGTANYDAFAVVRYHTNGTRDDSFGLGGIATTPLGTGGAEAQAVTLQADGRIVAAGTGSSGANSDFAVVRYTTNGTPDMSFDGDGKVITPIAASDDLASAVKVQADGKIVVAGTSVVGASVDMAVVRYHTNGSLDLSFGSLGKVATDLDRGSHDFGQALVIQPNGRILVGGYTLNGPVSFAAVRYHTNGVLDSSFDGDGKVTTQIGLGLDYGFALALQEDGKIVMSGASTTGGAQFAAVRYHVNGSPDDSYGDSGRVIAVFGNGGENIGYALALDSLGRAVIAGDAGGLFGLVRLQGDPVLRIRSIVRRPDDQVLLEGLGIPGLAHTLEASSNASPGLFGSLDSVTPDAGGEWRYQDTSAAGLLKRFYRLSCP